MKTYSKGWILAYLVRIQDGLGVSRKELAEILGVDRRFLNSLMRTTSGRVNERTVPLDKLKDLSDLIAIGKIALERNKFRSWLRDKNLPIYDGACPLDYLRQGDYEMVKFSLLVINDNGFM